MLCGGSCRSRRSMAWASRPIPAPPSWRVASGLGLDPLDSARRAVAVAQSVGALDCGAAEAMREHEVMLPLRASLSTDSPIVRHRPATNGNRFSASEATEFFLTSQRPPASSAWYTAGESRNESDAALRAISVAEGWPVLWRS